MLKIAFMGTPEFAVPSLQKLSETFELTSVWSQPDKATGRGLKVKSTPVKQKAIELNIDVFTPEKLSEVKNFEILKKINPDVIVVVAYGKLIKQNILDLPRLGCINVHSSLLPRWRGAAPIHRAILAGDSVTGVTTMKLVLELDAGDILLQSETPILLDDTAKSIHDRLTQMGSDLIVKTLKGLERGEISPKPQDESKVTYADKLTKEMEQMDLLQDANQMDRRVRALTPWPGTVLNVTKKGRLKVRKAKPVLDPTFSIGEIHVKDQKLYLGASKGSLELIEIQWEGRKAMLSIDFINQCKGQGMNFPLKVVGKKNA